MKNYIPEFRPPDSNWWLYVSFSDELELQYHIVTTRTTVYRSIKQDCLVVGRVVVNVKAKALTGSQFLTRNHIGFSASISQMYPSGGVPLCQRIQYPPFKFNMGSQYSGHKYLLDGKNEDKNLGTQEALYGIVLDDSYMEKDVQFTFNFQASLGNGYVGGLYLTFVTSGDFRLDQGQYRYAKRRVKVWSTAKVDPYLVGTRVRPPVRRTYLARS
ncbi:hypothetical protein T439DRAFT_378426 [Meredithblackwellia eburnea MCA 4105]